MKVHIFKSADELNRSLTSRILAIAKQAITTKGRFNFVLTGGNSPKALYQLLATKHKNEIDWAKVYFFFGDERNVLPNNRDYNGLMAKENLFNGLGIPEDHIFYIDTTLAPALAAEAYQKSLNQHFKNEAIAFDLVLLGIGDDAHTASLFPYTEILKQQNETVAAVWVEKLNTFRISLTAPLINKADNIIFLTFGSNKANALQHILNDTVKKPEAYPAQLIAPTSGNLDWFIDDQAAALLKS